MAEWLVDASTDPRRFPEVRHRHPNGTLTAVRDRTPTQLERLGEHAVERWAYMCPCGEVWTLDRERR